MKLTFRRRKEVGIKQAKYLEYQVMISTMEKTETGNGAREYCEGGVVILNGLNEVIIPTE